MAISRILLLRAFIGSAKDQATATSTTLSSVLKSVRNGKFNTDVTDGRTLISTTESGAVSTFTLPPGMEPMEIMALAQECLDYCAGFPDPENPVICHRRIKRLRASFLKASV